MKKSIEQKEAERIKRAMRYEKLKTLSTKSIMLAACKKAGVSKPTGYNVFNGVHNNEVFIDFFIAEVESDVAAKQAILKEFKKQRK